MAKRSIWLAVLAALLIVVPAAPGARFHSHSYAQHGHHHRDRDFARGKGTSLIGQVKFHAHGGPSPQRPVGGHFRADGALVGPVKLVPFTLRGPVTCLQVDGNQASFFYPVRRADPSALKSLGVFITVEDNGRARDGDPPDRLGFVGPIPLPKTSSCPPLPTELDTPLPLQKGNFTVHDAR